MDDIDIAHAGQDLAKSVPAIERSRAMPQKQRRLPNPLAPTMRSKAAKSKEPQVALMQELTAEVVKLERAHPLPRGGSNETSTACDMSRELVDHCPGR